MNEFGAFVPGPRAWRAPTGSGPLDGLAVAVKDLLDVAGTVTGGGNPDWGRRQSPATTSAPAVERLLRAGATLVGKTVTDELAFSLEGENHHHGTPINPRAPDRLPGGSSSGSAVAVAAGLADLALGTDTGGSVRVPASFCGVYGWRPTHGRVPLDGVVPFAPSYDTVGLLARDGGLLRRGAQVLLGTVPEATTATPVAPRFLLAGDALALAEPDAAAAVRAALAGWGTIEEIAVFDGDADSFREAYVTLQGLEIAASLGDFLATAPRFGPTLQPRFDGVRALAAATGPGTGPATAARWRAWREETTARLRRLLPPGTVLLLPSAPSIAPRRFLRGAAAGAFYDAALTLGSVAGHAGLPAVSVPLATRAGYPLGLGLVAGPGEDERLLAVAARLRVTAPAGRSARPRPRPRPPSAAGRE